MSLSLIIPTGLSPSVTMTQEILFRLMMPLTVTRVVAGETVSVFEDMMELIFIE
jgi:hypothetical protein